MIWFICWEHWQENATAASYSKQLHRYNYLFWHNRPASLVCGAKYYTYVNYSFWPLNMKRVQSKTFRFFRFYYTPRHINMRNMRSCGHYCTQYITWRSEPQNNTKDNYVKYK